MHYASVDDVIKMIKKLGPGCTLAETDVRSAFRMIPVHPKDYHLLGMQWRGKYYVRLLFANGACKFMPDLLECTGMKWVARNKLNIPHIVHILDDFLIAAESPGKCRAKLKPFLNF